MPTYDELVEAIFVKKTIEALAEDDTNVCVTGSIKEVGTDKNILKRCPNCNGNVEQTIEENVCDFCGHNFDEPDYTLMIPTQIEDETGEIQVTFFGKLAEELSGLKTDEVAERVEEGNGIEDKLEGLTGLTVEIIANVDFDEYSERTRLRPKKIISKYY